MNASPERGGSTRAIAASLRVAGAQTGAGKARCSSWVTAVSAGSLALSIFAAGCAVSRSATPGRSITQCDYCVVDRATSRGYAEDAASVLDRAMVVLDENDPRLELPGVQKKACIVSVGASRGFWSTSAWVDVKDYRTRNDVMRSHMRRGMLWMGARGDVMEALEDVAAARSAGPPLPEGARDFEPSPSEESRGVGRAKAERLAELDDLKTKGLITEAEYAGQRAAIIAD